MPQARLRDRRVLQRRALALVQLEQVKARRTTQDLAHGAWLQARERAGEELSGSRSWLRQPTSPPCSASGASEKLAAGSRSRRPRARLGERLLRAGARRLDALRAWPAQARAPGCGDLAHRVGLRLHLGEEEVDLRVAHLDAVVDLACARASAPSARAGPRARPGTTRRRAPARGENRRGLCCCSAPRAAPRGRAAARRSDALVARELQLCLVQDQPLEHLALEQAALRQRRLLPPQLALRRRHCIGEPAVITSLFTTATMRSTEMTPCPATGNGRTRKRSAKRASFPQYTCSNGSRASVLAG